MPELGEDEQEGSFSDGIFQGFIYFQHTAEPVALQEIARYPWFNAVAKQTSNLSSARLGGQR